MSWTFGIVNGRLAEVYYRGEANQSRVWTHCYIKREEFKTKKEQKWIDQDTKHARFVYRKGKYRRI